MKTCTKCKVPKELKEFPVQSKRPDGKASQCNTCSNERHRVRYHANPELKDIKAKSNRERSERNREYVHEYLRTHPCIDCGEKDIVVLEFDHKGDKISAVSNMLSRHSLEKIKQEIDKCEVRCANCHRRKTAKDLGWYKKS